MRKAIIVDLDGTLCNTDHRKHHVENGAREWTDFYRKLSDDRPHDWCNAILSWVPLHIHVLFVSGRPDNWQSQTLTWLNQFSKRRDFRLFMRKENDFRKDSIVKTEIYKTHIEPEYQVLFCIDDRQQVVDAWRGLGLTCLQCAKGDF